MKASFLTFFLVLIVAPLFGQTSIGDDDHYMYWRMRSRLRNHFVAVGFEASEALNSTTSIYGIPAGAKLLVQDELDRITPDDSTYMIRRHIDNGPKNSYDLKWGDGVEQPAWYLGVLATDYVQLKH